MSFAESVNCSGKYKLKVICVAYDREIELGILIDSFRVQTCPDWELNVIYDGNIPTWFKKLITKHNKDARIRFYNSDERYEKYGHPNRRALLKRLIGTENDFLLMTNDDNYYVPKYVEYMLSAIDDKTGIVFCNTVHSHFDYRLHISELKCKGIDMGAFIVRFDIAKQTGFNSYDFNADGMYAEECKRTCDKRQLQYVWIQKPLFIHN